MNEKQPIGLFAMMASWFSASLFFLSGEIVFDFGALGGIGLALSLLMGLVFVLLFKGQGPIKQESSSLIYTKRLLSILISFEVILFQLYAGYILLQNTRLHNEVDIVLFLLVSLMGVFVINFFVQNKFVKYTHMLKVALIFSLAIFLPNYIYLQKGLETVFHNLLHYHPRVLHENQQGLLSFMVAATIISFFKISTQVKEINLKSRHPFQWRKKLFAGMIAVATTILAFSSMTIVAITEKIKGVHINETLILLIKQKTSPMIFFIVASILLLLVFIPIYESFWGQSRGFSINSGKIGSIAQIVFAALMCPFLYDYNISLVTLYLIVGLLTIPLAMFLGFSSYFSIGSYMLMVPIICWTVVFNLQKTIPISTLIVVESILSLTIFLLYILIIHLISLSQKVKNR